MNIPIFRGSLLPFLQSEKWAYDPSRGWVYSSQAKGIGAAQIQALQQSMVADGVACALTHFQGDTWGLEMEDSTYAYTVDRWEVVTSEEARSLLNHPTLLEIATPDLLAVMKDAIDHNMTESDFYDAITGYGGISSGDQGVVSAFYGMMLRDQNEFRHQQYVLRHTTNAPARWTQNVADTGVGEIYTLAQLLTEVTNSALWIYPLPARLNYKLSNIPAPDAVDDYRWGWLKSASTECTAANNRVDIVTEYVLEQWSSYVYNIH